MPYNRTGVIYVLNRCINVSGSRPLCPWYPPPKSPYALLLAFLIFSSTFLIMLSFSDVVLIIPRCNADSTVGIVCAPSLNSLEFKDLLFGFTLMFNATLLVGCNSHPYMYA